MYHRPHDRTHIPLPLIAFLCSFLYKKGKRYVQNDTKENVKLTPQHAVKAQRVSRELYFSFNISARPGWVVNATLRLLYPQE
jgi:hypothetical protein